MSAMFLTRFSDCWFFVVSYVMCVDIFMCVDAIIYATV